MPNSAQLRASASIWRADTWSATGWSMFCVGTLWSMAGLVEATGLSRPTAHRLAAALEAHRLVGRDGSGRYRLGLRLLGWAGAVSTELGLVEAARPVLEALRDETGESAQLFVRDGDSRLCVAASERPSGLRD